MADKFVNINNSTINNRSNINQADNNKACAKASPLKDTLLKLISDNNISEALESISDKLDQNCTITSKREYIHISSQYQRIMEEKRLNVVFDEDFDLTLNKIINSLIEYIENYF